jgi:AraC-like DNA-binding protein
MNVASYSARFVAPFAQVLSTYECYSVAYLDRLRAIDPATRISASAANELAAHQVQQTGDPDLGLKAGHSMILGQAGALGYAMHSAANVRKAIEVGQRYSRLFSDLLEIQYEVEGDRAIVRVDVGPSAPRLMSDFAMSAWFKNHFREPLLADPHLECWFSHAKPADTAAYERAFAPATLRFGAPCCGFSFAREYLNAPLAGADPVLHSVFCEYVAARFGQLSGHGYTGRVREIARRELLRGTPTVFVVARELRMSARTLARRLEREGTTFSALLDRLRHEIALHHVGREEMALAEVAFRLGFSHVEALHRAFKRWTGQTPGAYRHARRFPPLADSAASRATGLFASPSLLADAMANWE